LRRSDGKRIRNASVNARLVEITRERTGRTDMELCALPILPDWPQFGIELTAGWARRG
jgi:hypothetical protein